MKINKTLGIIGSALLTAGFLYLASPAYTQTSYPDLAKQQKDEKAMIIKTRIQDIETKIQELDQLNSGLEGYIVEHIKDYELDCNDNEEIREYLEKCKSLVTRIQDEAKKYNFELSNEQKNKTHYDSELLEALENACFHGKDEGVKEYFQQRGIELEKISALSFWEKTGITCLVYLGCMIIVGMGYLVSQYFCSTKENLNTLK